MRNLINSVGFKKKLRETPKEAWVGVWKTCAIATISMYSLCHPGYWVCLSAVDALQQYRLLAFKTKLNRSSKVNDDPIVSYVWRSIAIKAVEE